MKGLIPSFEAWRVLRLGSSEVIDALVAPEHRGPSPALRAGLDGWPGAWYWLDAERTQLVLIRQTAARKAERWLLHGALLALTVVCSLGAGAALAGSWYPSLGHGLGGVVTGVATFFRDIGRDGWRMAAAGWSFAFPLLGILLVHELGHYFAARRYAIDVSPPFFLPIPPNLSPIGSLGAFLRLRSPVLDRRQLLDVGAAGPLAGFVAALGVLVWGYATSAADPGSGASGDHVTFAGTTIELGQSLLTRGLRAVILPGAHDVALSLPAFAGWVGAFVTGLNLLPLSQLDGGHVLYGLIGRRQASVALATVAGLLWLAQYSPSWYIWVVLSLLIGGGKWTHPTVAVPERPVPPSRRWIGWLCVALFVLTFVGVPFRG
jgi:Zn-dependent protease